jgi:hypothetical protein
MSLRTRRLSQPIRHLASLALVAPLLVGAGSCKKSAGEPQTLAPVTDPGGDAIPSGRLGAEPTEVEMTRLRGSVENLDDVLAAVSDLMARLEPEDAKDIKTETQALLLQFGFGPGFLSNIDLAGMHAVSFHYPQSEESASPDAAELAATIAVLDPRKVIDSTPPAFRPQPLGEGVWEFRQNQTRVLLREAGKELLIGLKPDDLERASGLRAGVQPNGRRIRLRAENVPVDDIDPAELLGLPSGSKLARDLAKVVQEATGFDLELEIGTDRDLEVVAAAQAPFHQLGIEPLGKPRAAATALEGRLPPRPVFAATLSWGDPALVHKVIDGSIQLGQVPGPFRELVEKAVGSVHALLDQVANDVVVALYLDDRGKASIVVAADVRDAAATGSALQQLEESLVSAAEAQRVMAGKNKDAQFGVDYKANGLTVPGGKANRFTLTIAKDFLSDFAKASIFLDKNKLETISFARGDTAVVIIGAGGRKLASDISGSLGKTRKDSLAQSLGLEQVRKSMGGCQICLAGDPLDYLRLRMLLLQDGGDKALAKTIKSNLDTLRKLEKLGESSAGLKVEREAAAASLVLPKKTLHASADTLAKVRELFGFVENPTVAQPTTK